MLNYGAEYILQTKEVKQKRENTCIERYGVKNISLSKEIQEKRSITNIEKYGFSVPCKNKEVYNKMKETMIKKYGVSYAMQNQELCKKQRTSANITWCKNNNVPTSIQQIYLCNLLNGKLNVPCDQFVIDIVLNNIAIEYDGGGHKMPIYTKQMTNDEFLKKEIRRFDHLKRNSYKLIKIISKYDFIPQDTTVLDMISYAKKYLQSEHNWIEFDIDSKTVKTSQYTEGYEFGLLRKIIKNK